MSEPLTLEALADAPLADQCLALQERGRLDFAYFCRHLLGYADMNAEHEALCEFLQYESAPLRLVLMPRGTFKSHIATIGHLLWVLLNDPNQRTLIVSDATEKAQGFLAGIRYHIEGTAPHSLFRDIVRPTWDVDPKRGTWNQAALSIKPRTEQSIEASVETAGLETSKVGRHYHWIKVDDLVTEANVTTKELMDKVAEVFASSSQLLLRAGRRDVVGTRWHFGDLYGRLLAEWKGTPSFAYFHRKAEDNGRLYFADIGKESLTVAQLILKRKELGSRKYSCLIQNEPVDDETATFKAKDFHFYQAQHQTETYRQWVSQLYITCVLDPIPPPASDHGDDAAITVVGTDSEHVMYLLEAVAGRLTVEQQIEEVLSLHAVWKFRKFGIETNAFQRTLLPMIEQRLRELRRNPHWQPFSIVEFSGTTQGNKEQRIEGLQPWHEQGLLRFPGTKLELLQGVWSQLAFQMLQFNRSQKDDLLDSLAYHLQLKQAGSLTVPVQELPYRSAAWAAEQERKEEIASMQRRPRWQRRPVPELAWT